MVEGWIFLHRKLQECEIWANSQPFDMRSAWVDLLLLANHRDVAIVFDYEPMTVKRGQYLTSVRKLSARWSWSKNRTLKYLRLLESLGMIHRESNNQRTLITIDNYSIYQDMRDTNEDTKRTRVKTQSGHEADTGMPQTNNDKNEKNEKNIKNNNIYPSSFNEFWQNYPRKQDKGQAYKCYQARLNDGYTEEQLLTACINYAAECDHDKREKKYIKVASTFLSVNEPFAEYLDEEKSNEQSKGRTDRDISEERESEIREIIRRIESGEADHDDDGLWDGLP